MSSNTKQKEIPCILDELIPLRLALRIEQEGLRIPDSYDAKLAKIYIIWTFWPVIELINHQVNRCPDLNVQRLQILVIFVS